jgi:hypothetical protein
MVYKGKLSKTTVVEIRKLAAGAVGSYDEIADTYGLSKSYISAIARGVVYEHCGGPRTYKRRPKAGSDTEKVLNGGNFRKSANKTLRTTGESGSVANLINIGDEFYSVWPEMKGRLLDAMKLEKLLGNFHTDE